MSYSIGIDLGGTKCAVLLGASDLYQTPERLIVSKSVLNTGKTGNAYEVIAEICARIDSALDKYHVKKEEVIGIGVSCGGPLDSKKGIILNPPNLYQWNNIPIAQILYERYHLPVALENDANACAVAEWKFGAAAGYDNVIFLTFGTGLGAGLILNGSLYRGENDMAGEVGHIRLSEFGPVGFGKAGSFEGFCSGGGIAEIARMKVLEYLQLGKPQSLCKDLSDIGRLDAKSVAEAAASGDELAKEIYAISGRYLGKGLSILIDILNPGIIVLGSIFERSKELLWSETEKVIQKESLWKSRSACKIVPAKLGNNIGDYAALSLAIYNFGGADGAPSLK